MLETRHLWWHLELCQGVLQTLYLQLKHCIIDFEHHILLLHIVRKRLYQHRPQIAKTNFCEQCNVCKKLKTKFIAVFLGVWVKLVALKIGTYETEIGTLQWHPPRPLPQSWPSPSSPTIAHWNGTLQWHPPCPLPQSWPSPSSPTIAHWNGTLQWHPPRPLPPKLAVTLLPHHSTLEWHPAMAPTTSTPPKLAVTLLPHHSTLEWHPAMAPRQLPQSWSSPPNHSTLQWHPAMAPRPLPQSWPLPSSPHHSTQQWQWHPAMAPRPLPQSWSAHYNGTQKWHHVHCTLQWHPGATSNPPKWVVALPPIGSKNPYSYRYLGNKEGIKKHHVHLCYSLIIFPTSEAKTQWAPLEVQWLSACDRIKNSAKITESVIGWTGLNLL